MPAMPDGSVPCFPSSCHALHTSTHTGLPEASSSSGMVRRTALLALPQPPTCILFPDDFSAIGGLNTIAAAGLRVPDDISVAGYDGIYLSQTMSPRLTTYRQDTAALGRTAAARLIELIEKPRTTVMDRTVVTGALLPGGTVARPRTE